MSPKVVNQPEIKKRKKTMIQIPHLGLIFFSQNAGSKTFLFLQTLTPG